MVVSSVLPCLKLLAFGFPFEILQFAFTYLFYMLKVVHLLEKHRLQIQFAKILMYLESRSLHLIILWSKFVMVEYVALVQMGPTACPNAITKPPVWGGQGLTRTIESLKMMMMMMMISVGSLLLLLLLLLHYVRGVITSKHFALFKFILVRNTSITEILY
jgi:hypothetical protein